MTTKCERPSCPEPAVYVLTLAEGLDVPVCHEDLGWLEPEIVDDARAVDPTDEHAVFVANEFLTFGVVEGR